MRIVVGITGSSGAMFAREFLKECPGDKYLVVSRWGKVLLKDELGIGEKELSPFVKRQFSDDDLAAPLASGSNAIDAVVILPCSVSTMGKIASGIGDTLITRAAQVALKERKKLVLCLRETPLSTLALEQAARLSRDGAMIMPIAPPCYHVPKSVDELVRAFTARVQGILGFPVAKGWRAEELE
ncbi:MAG TPA: UbiX family flavin prenyltransferase [Bacteroidota bacterium]|nr:UbiX family flavin prenyltransferase [Bacteroidota bacterium]